MFLLLLYLKHVIKLSGYNLGCYTTTFSLIKKELHVNVLGARSVPSVPRERYNCRIITKQFSDL